MADEPKTTQDSGNAKYDIFIVRGGVTKDDDEFYPAGIRFYDTTSTVAKQWIAVNPEEAKKITQQWVNEPGISAAEAKRRKNLPMGWREIEAVSDAIMDTNNKLPKAERPQGWHFITVTDGRDCNGVAVKVPVIQPGQSLVLPEGNELGVFEAHYECPPERKRPKPLPVQTPEVKPEPKPRVDNELVMDKQYEFLRQDAPSMDNKVWRPGTTLHSLEVLARTGLNPEFTKQYYALKNVAARKPVISTRDSGEIGGNVNGNISGDFMNEGQYGLGEDPESRKDDAARKRDATTGRRGVIGKYMTGPRQPGFVTGHTTVLDDGSFQRAESMPFEWAHGGDYAYDIGGVRVPLGNMLGLPVGGLKIAPSKQSVLPADTARWGLSQTWADQAAVNETNKNNAFRDQQTTLSGPLDSPDRITAYTYLLNADKTFVDSMHAFDAATTPEEKQAAAVRALVANRDSRDNLLVKRIDSKRIPLEQDAEGVRRYFASQGVDLAKVDALVAQAPRLELVDMPQSQLEQQQDYKALKDSRYAGIVPGQTNAAFKADMAAAYPVMNSTEATIASGVVKPTAEADLISINRDTMNAIRNAPKFNEVLAQQIVANPNLGITVVNALRDFRQNYELYGFKSKDEADKYIKNIVGDNKAAYAQLTLRADTTPVPVLGRDQPNGGAVLSDVVPAIAAKFAADPAVAGDVLDRLSNPQLGLDKKGKSDGRRYATGFFRAIAADRGSKQDGEAAPSYQAFASLLSPADAAKFEQSVTQSGSRGEDGASGVSTFAVQTYDNLLRVAQLGAQSAKDPSIVAVLKGDDAALDALRKRGDGGEKLTVIATNETGLAIFNAASKGDLAGVYNGLLSSEDARLAGRDALAVVGMRDHPALARDAVLLTLLRSPDALNNAFDQLKKLDKSVLGDKYGELRSDLMHAREAALRYQTSHKQSDMDTAVRSFASFFANMEGSKGDGYNLRAKAWDNFLIELGRDPAASAWIVDTISKDEGLRNGLLKAGPDAIGATGNARPVNQGGSGITKAELDGDEVYTSRFFTLATDKKSGRVQTARTALGASKIGVNKEDISTALAGNADVADVMQTLVAGGVTNTTPTGQPDMKVGAVLDINPVIYTGTNKGVDATAVLAGWMENQKVPAPAGMTYQQLAADSIKAGLVTVTGEADTLKVTVSPTALSGTLATGGDLTAVPGIALWWLLIHKPKEPPHDQKTIPGEPPCCTPTVPPQWPVPPNPPTLPPLPPM